MASLESIAHARQWQDQLTAELNGHREKLRNLETYEEDAKSSRLNLLVRDSGPYGLHKKDGTLSGSGCRATLSFAKGRNIETRCCQSRVNAGRRKVAAAMKYVSLNTACCSASEA